MIGVGGAIALGVAGVAAAALAAHGMIESTQISADAQRDVAETNGNATIEASRNAMFAQTKVAEEQAEAQKHDADQARAMEQDYLSHEIRMLNEEQKSDAFYGQMYAEIDSIHTVDEMDMQYAESGPWGSGSAPPYDHGYDSGGGMTFS